jgi:hypothetical protein
VGFGVGDGFGVGVGFGGCLGFSFFSFASAAAVPAGVPAFLVAQETSMPTVRQATVMRKMWRGNKGREGIGWRGLLAGEIRSRKAAGAAMFLSISRRAL